MRHLATQKSNFLASCLVASKRLACLVWLSCLYSPLRAWPLSESPDPFAVDPFAFNQYVLDQWNWRQGLPQETLTAIRQSADGYLWIATANGLFRFNGSTAVEVQLPNERVSDRRLRALEADESGAVWVMATSGALWRKSASGAQGRHELSGPDWVNLVAAQKGSSYLRAGIRPLKDRVRLLDDRRSVDYRAQAEKWQVERSVELPSGSIASTMDASANVFAVQEQGQVSKLQPSGEWKELFRLSTERIHLLQSGQNGVLWMRSATAIYRWKSGTVERWELPPGFIGASTYYPFIEDHEGSVWLGGRGAILRLQNGTLTKLTLSAELHETPVSALFEDREGALWVGTLTGVLLRLSAAVANSIGRAEGLAGDVVNSVYAERSDNGAESSYWVHTMNQGLTSHQGDKLQSVEGHFGNLWFLARDPAGNRIVAGNGEKQVQLLAGNLVEVADPFQPQLGKMSGWWRDSQGGGFIVGRSSGVYRQSSLIEPQSRSSLPGSKLFGFPSARLLSFGAPGQLWVSDGKKIAALGAAAEEWITPPGQEWDEKIFCLRWEESGRSLWVGTSRGIVIWNPLRKQWSKRLIEADQVFLLERDRASAMWAGTRKGLVRIAPANGRENPSLAPLRLMHSDGLKNLNFGMTLGQGSALLESGKLLFASMGGLVVVDPSRIRRPHYAPDVAIEEVSAGESGESPGIDGTLPAGTRRVQIRFDAFAISTNSLLQVDYLLEGVDEKWQAAEQRRNVQYTNLRPGPYRFHLRAAWPDGSQANEKVVQWEIKPLLYERPWFPWSLAGMISAAVGALLWQSRQQRIRRERELEQRVEERTQELSVAKKEADRAAQVKAEFLATMSHELRTPMNGVLGLAELLHGTNLTAEQMDLVSTLRGSGESLLALVNDILDLSRLESGRLELERIPVHIPALLAETLKLIQPLAAKKGLPVHLTSSGEVIEWMEGDPTRIRQILLNLLGNAIKFTPQGSVTIETLWSPGELRINVRDTGIGIPEDKISDLFENFVQVDSSTNRLYGGSGLGLAISRKLVEAMQGTIHCQSRLGEGSCFSVRIPARASSGPQVSGKNLQEFQLAGLEVLVAEDNPTNQRVIVGLLTKLGIKSRLVSNGLEALEVLQRERFDLILMDCQMPIMDGYEATPKIKALLGKTAPPIIALTAHALASDRARCLEAGMTGYLSKPVSLERLRQALLETMETEGITPSSGSSIRA
jgi:signal transduction histidine kinase/ActR/RegA family two-component response regulator